MSGGALPPTPTRRSVASIESKFIVEKKQQPSKSERVQLGEHRAGKRINESKPHGSKASDERGSVAHPARRDTKKNEY